mmetsp:Transcript_32640/g.69559  ORF Transcript_32640/g.69559 Transcript_32640/m.69559 type:complete len:89 (-) Transcript_32640:76-342(-)
MTSNEMKRIMLADYACVHKLVASLCGEPMASSESIIGDPMSNSAVAQNYTDFWSMHNRTLPLHPFNQFWDEISDILAEVCCLELVKIN